MDLWGKSICVLDLETAHSADDCQHCGQSIDAHTIPSAYCVRSVVPPGHVEHAQFTAIGWDNKPALGLSIGCYYDYRDRMVHWFDVHTLEETVRGFVEAQPRPLLVSFNGISFDFVLMRGLLRIRAEDMLDEDIPDYTDEPTGSALAPRTKRQSSGLVALCDVFTILCATSYDILAEIWKVDPANQFAPGLNSLDAISRANGLGGKLSHGAEAPRDWRAGQYAKVLNYCQDDVLKTKALFEQIMETGMIMRGNLARIRLPAPVVPVRVDEEPHQSL